MNMFIFKDYISKDEKTNFTLYCTFRNLCAETLKTGEVLCY